MPLKKLFKYDPYCGVIVETKKTIQDIDRIEITKCDDESIKLEAFSGNVRVKCVVGTPDDDHLFDFNICAKTAIDMLYKDYDMTPKQKRKPYNGRIFVAHYPGVALCDNTIYEVVNGRLFGPILRDPYIFADMNDDDLSHAIHMHLYGGTGQEHNCTVAYFIEE